MIPSWKRLYFKLIGWLGRCELFCSVRLHHLRTLSWVNQQVEIQRCAKRCCIIWDVSCSYIESNSILIWNNIGFECHFEPMKLKNCVAQLDHIIASKVLCYRLRQMWISIIYKKVHGIKPAEWKTKQWNTIKMTRIRECCNSSHKSKGIWKRIDMWISINESIINVYVWIRYKKGSIFQVWSRWVAEAYSMGNYHHKSLHSLLGFILKVSNVLMMNWSILFRVLLSCLNDTKTHWRQEPDLSEIQWCQVAQHGFRQFFNFMGSKWHSNPTLFQIKIEFDSIYEQETSQIIQHRFAHLCISTCWFTHTEYPLTDDVTKYRQLIQRLTLLLMFQDLNSRFIHKTNLL